MLLRAVVLATVLVAAGCAPSVTAAPPARADTTRSPVPAASRQLVLVVTDDWGATTGRLRRFERGDGSWTGVGAPVQVVVGRSGLGWGIGLHAPPAAGPTKAEGDGRAPAGAFLLTAAFGYADAEATGLPYHASRPSSVCVDDVASPQYNTVFDADTLAAPATWTSRERMRRDDALYRLGVVVAHNGPGVDPAWAGQASSVTPTPGGGSCIFLHVWRGPRSTTSGCTAMPGAALEEVLAWLDADAQPVLVQLPATEYRRLRAAWRLP